MWVINMHAVLSVFKVVLTGLVWFMNIQKAYACCNRYDYSLFSIECLSQIRKNSKLLKLRFQDRQTKVYLI